MEENNKPSVFKIGNGTSGNTENLKEEKPKTMFSEIQEEMFGTAIEAMMPKIMPFIKPAMEKFSQFLGDNEKTIIIRRLKNGNPSVFIFDNTKGSYAISNDSATAENKFSGSAGVGAENSPINQVYDISMFVNKLLTGELLQYFKDKK